MALMLLKELKIIAAKIEESKEEKDFWKEELENQKTNINILDKKDGELVLDDDDDLDDDVDDYDIKKEKEL